MLNMTRDETKAFWFLAVVVFAGLAINLVIKAHPKTKQYISAPRTTKINLNKADQRQLKLAPGIGDKISQRILEYRQKNEKFYNIEELKQIKGISPKKFEKIKDCFEVKS